MDRSRKRPIVFAIRYFPLGCGTSRSNLPEKGIKNPRTSDHVAIENPRTTDHVVAAPQPQGTCLKPEAEFKNSDHGHFVAALKPKGTCFRQEPDHCHAVAETSSLSQGPDFKSPYHGHVDASPEHEGTSSLRKEPEIKNSDHDDPTPREKVLEVLRLFNEVFTQLDRDKRRGVYSFDATSRIDIKTQAVLKEMGKQVNTEKRIGSVPGIKVGDEFQYKTELRLVGLHFKTMCGIDYMKIGGEKIATSIVASDGYGYNDKFEAGVMVYTGEGGNVISKGKKTEDQKLVKGNFALANSMRQKREVRVIRGEERWDRKGKRYVYDGLYLVDKYWSEKGVSGKCVYKFKLCRIPGQPPLT